MDGKKVQITAEKAREEGNFLDALRLTDEATLLYQKEGKIVDLCEVIASRFLIFSHLYDQTDDRNFLILAKFAAKTAVKMAKKSENEAALAIPLFYLGKAYHLLDKHDDAIEKFNDALEALPKSPQNRPSVEADIKVNLAVCEYICGDVTALNKAENALHKLEGTNESKYEKDVWVSGAYMRLAKAIAKADPAKSKGYLETARQIIEDNPELKLQKLKLDRISSRPNGKLKA